jgi:hypothetical protein
MARVWASPGVAAWVRAQAALTRQAIGDVPDAEAEALPD